MPCNHSATDPFCVQSTNALSLWLLLTLMCDTSFFYSLQKTFLLCLRMKEVRAGAPGAASKKQLQPRHQGEPGQWRGNRRGNTTCAQNPLLWTSGIRSKLRVRGQGAGREVRATCLQAIVLFGAGGF